MPAVLLLFAATFPAMAAKASAQPEELEKQATHIVTGKIVDVTTEVRKSTVENGALRQICLGVRLGEERVSPVMLERIPPSIRTQHPGG